MPDTAPVGFPYGLNDLAYWIIKRTDGTVIKHILENGRGGAKHDPLNFAFKDSPYMYAPTSLMSTGNQAVHKTTVSEWCKHDPVKPIFSTEKVKLYIADAIGARAYKSEFDLIIDCGKVFTPYDATPYTTSSLSGDSDLVKALEHHSIWESNPLRTLKINWNDREAPELLPAFWGDLAGRLEGNIMIDCQGGHGRSGTALTCLMMALNPEYGTKDAIIHLRAMHCPRAIESSEQHKYIDTVAVALGRTANGSEIGKVKNFRVAFLAMKHKSAKVYQDQLKGV